MTQLDEMAPVRTAQVDWGAPEPSPAIAAGPGATAPTMLICIGAQKAGTTWLHSYFRDHPEVYVPPLKEVHYFDFLYGGAANKTPVSVRLAAPLQKQLGAFAAATPAKRQAMADGLVRRMDRFAMYADERRYMRFFKDRAGAHKVMCDITPGYAVVRREGFEAMRRLCGRPRILFIVRNPADRVWSHYRFHIQKRAALNAAAADAGDLAAFMNEPHVAARTRYQETLKHLDAVFPKEDVHVAFYESLFSEGETRRICDFAGVSHRPGDYDVRVNASHATALSAEDRRCLVQGFGDVYGAIAERFPAALPPSWREDMAAHLT
ncbi:MAG: sulfotransferase [Pseudomonadota bacterium]